MKKNPQEIVEYISVIFIVKLSWFFMKNIQDSVGNGVQEKSESFDCSRQSSSEIKFEELDLQTLKQKLFLSRQHFLTFFDVLLFPMEIIVI